MKSSGTRSVKITTNWDSVLVTAFSLFSVYFTGTDTGYVAGGAGTILKTYNGGVDWTIQNSTATRLFSLFFPSTDTGYAVGSSGTVIKTINGGGYPLGIINQPPSQNTLTIFPNPSRGNIIVKSLTISPGSRLYILNMSGQVVCSEILDKPGMPVDIHNLPEGIYMVKVLHVSGIETGKFIKVQ